MRRHPRRTTTDPTQPSAWGTCDRSGFILDHRNMRQQFEWAGTKLINKQLLVAPDMEDRPNRQLGTIILPPDPVPILNARPENYYVEEQTIRLQQNGQARYQMNGQIRLESNLQSNVFVLGVSTLGGPDVLG